MNSDVDDDDIEVEVEDGAIIVSGSVPSAEGLDGIRDQVYAKSAAAPIQAP